MSFAISGASGSGKTTLAKGLAEELGVPYFDASFGRLARGLGYNSVAPMDFAGRLTMQEGVLAAYRREVADLPRPFVTDRCPLDMIAYALGEVTMHDGQAEHGERVMDYIDECLRATIEIFDSVVFVRPLPGAYEASPHRPPASRPYQWATQFLMEGAMGRLNGVEHAYLLTADREERLHNAAGFLRGRVAALRHSARRPGLH